MDDYTTTVFGTWRGLHATTVRGIGRIIFYVPPPPELLMLCAVWSIDMLIMASPNEPYASIWLPQPVHSWLYNEEANRATAHLPLSKSIDAVVNNDVFLPPPPSYDETMSTFFIPPPRPPSCDGTMSSSSHPVINIMSDDDDERKH